MMQDDSNLIGEFVRNDSQAAFTAIVECHIDFVYSAALRQVNGDSGLASDISETVFLDLVRKARTLKNDIVLTAWLHRATRLSSLSALRAKNRRIVREQAAVRMQELERTPESADWNCISAIIDEVLDKLSEKDREAILLRYFQKKSFPDMSIVLQTSEDAARMRVERALEKLRVLLGKKGITSTGAALSGALNASSTLAAPSGLSVSIAQAASVAITKSSLIPLTIMATSKMKLGIAALVAAGTMIVATREHLSKRQLEKMLAVQTQRIEQLNQTAAASDGANAADRNEVANLRREHLELMRVRGEVVGLREAKNTAERLLAKNPGRPGKTETDEPSNPEIEAYKTIALARMNYTRGWAMAFMAYAEENAGMMPGTFAEAAKHYPANLASIMSAFDPEKFEIVFNGSLKDVTQPEKTIIVREKASFSYPNQPGYARTYLFADGHSEIHSSPDGNFEPWESTRLASPLQPKTNQ